MSGDVKEVKNEGMPAVGNPNRKGSLFVKLIIEAPKASFLTPGALVRPQGFFIQCSLLFVG